MSRRYIGGDWADPVISDETIFEELSEEDLLQMRIEKHLEEEEHLLQQIKVADSERKD